MVYVRCARLPGSKGEALAPPGRKNKLNAASQIKAWQAMKWTCRTPKKALGTRLPVLKTRRSETLVHGMQIVLGLLVLLLVIGLGLVTLLLLLAIGLGLVVLLLLVVIGLALVVLLLLVVIGLALVVLLLLVAIGLALVVLLLLVAIGLALVLLLALSS